MRKSLAIALLSVVCGSCALFDGSDDGTVEVRTTLSTYSLGDTIEAQVSNLTNKSLFFDNCCGPLMLHIEKGVDGTWDALPGTCTALCNSVLTEIKAGETRIARDDYSPALTTPGTYRLSAHFWRERNAAAPFEQAASETFAVVGVRTQQPDYD